MPFHDREHAARLLARELRAYKGQNPLILAVLRGAVPMGKVLADALDGELDVVLVRARQPRKLIAAVGVAPRASVAELRTLADDVVCLEAPPLFFAVGELFEDFRQVEDDEVVAILRDACRHETVTPAAGPRGRP